MTFDYWADDEQGKPATLEYLMSKLKDEKKGYIREKVRDGGSVLNYSYGKIVLRGRLPHEMAERLTIRPKGILKSTTFEENHKSLKSFIESSGIKLKRIMP